MADTSYRIVQREDNSFVVEFVPVGALPQIAAGFATEAAAIGWIARDQRFRAAANKIGFPQDRRQTGY